MGSVYVPLVVTAPTTEPITSAELKAQARITTDDDDTLISRIITVARQQCELISERIFIDTVFDQWWDGFPNEFVLPRTPVDSITSITYTDTNGTTQTVSSSVYTLDNNHIPERIILAFEQSWPTDTRAIDKVVKIRWKAGYGTATTDVPEHMRHAVLLLAAHYYENREAFTTDNLRQVPEGVRCLLATDGRMTLV